MELPGSHCGCSCAVAPVPRRRVSTLGNVGCLDDVPTFSDSKALPLLTRGPLLFILGQPLSPGKSTGEAGLRNQTGLMWRCNEGVICKDFNQKQSLVQQ